MSFSRFGCRIRSDVFARDQRVFASNEDKIATATLGLVDTKAFTCHKEIPGCQHIQVPIPLRQACLSNRRTGRQTGVIDDYVDATKGPCGLLKSLMHASLVSNIHLHCHSSSATVVLVEVCCQLLRTDQIDICCNDLRTIPRHTLTNCRTDTPCRAGHQHHISCELALWWCQLEFVLL